MGNNKPIKITPGMRILREEAVFFLKVCGGTYKEIGILFGVSAERVKQIYNAGCLRREMENSDNHLTRMGFSFRVAMVFEENNIKTLEDLLKKTSRDLLRMKHFGAKCLFEVENLLSKEVLCLRK